MHQLFQALCFGTMVLHIVACSYGTSAASSPSKSEAQIEIALLGPYVPFNDAAQDERSFSWWPKRTDDRWQALCPVGETFRLISVRLDTTPKNIDDKPGLMVTADQCPSAIVLIRGLRSLVVAPARITRMPGPKNQDTTWLITFQKQTSKVYFRDSVGLPLMLETPEYTQELRNWNAASTNIASESTRHDYGFDAGVEILWAGDLNSDQQLDLLLKQGDAEIGTSIELYLSGSDTNPQHLLLVDSFDLGGC